MNPQTRRLLSFTAAVLIAVFGLSMVEGQSPFEIQVFVDNDTLIVYVPQAGLVSLDGLGLQVQRNGQNESYRLQDYPAFGIPFSTVITPVCFRLREAGTQIPLPTQCPPNATFTQDLAPVNVFWYDPVANTPRTITLILNGMPFAYCPAGNNLCVSTFTPPTHTPIPTATITPTITPTPEFTPTPTLTPTPEFTLTPTPYLHFEGRNTDWTPQIETINGIEVALVPPGCFTMGSEDIDDAPPHEQCIDEPFYIGVTEVSNAQYARCVDERVCTPPADQTYFADRDYADHPVVYVDWFQARDFAEWWGARLPTEREWEYAGRGVESWEYPWGDDWGLAMANISGSSDGYNITAPVGSFPEGSSWVGAFDMSGNAWEWMNSLYDDYPYDPDDGREVDTGDRTAVMRVLRGGAWGLIQGFARVARRYRDYSLYWYADFGFRVVLGAPPT